MHLKAIYPIHLPSVFLSCKLRELNRSRWQAAFNRISSKHFDFLLCDPADLQPGLAIELDDKSHRRPDRIRQDRFVEAACESAGLPLLRIKAARAYIVADIRSRIDHALSPPETDYPE